MSFYTQHTFLYQRGVTVLNYQWVEAWAKWQTPCRKHFKMHPLWLKCINFYYSNILCITQAGSGIVNHSSWEREREIKFFGLFGDRGHQGPYSPYKPCNHNLYIGIIIFPHIDNPQATGYNQPKKKTIKIINEKSEGPINLTIIGEKDSGSVYTWI